MEACVCVGGERGAEGESSRIRASGGPEVRSGSGRSLASPDSFFSPQPHPPVHTLPPLPLSRSPKHDVCFTASNRFGHWLLFCASCSLPVMCLSSTARLPPASGIRVLYV